MGITSHGGACLVKKDMCLGRAVSSCPRRHLGPDLGSLEKGEDDSEPASVQRQIQVECKEEPRGPRSIEGLEHNAAVHGH